MRRHRLGQFIECDAIGDIELADARSAEAVEYAARAEGFSDIARKRADVSSLAAGDVQFEQRPVEPGDLDAVDAHGAGLELRQTLESVDGIGATLSQHLMAVGFDIEAAPTDRDEVAIRMGAAPVFVGTGDKKNGKGKKGYTKMRSSTSSLARRTTYLLGRLASQNLAWAKAQYAHARSRGKNAATAYRIVARSLLRILSAVIRNNEPYDEERYIRRLIAQGVPWAADLRPVPPEPA